MSKPVRERVVATLVEIIDKAMADVADHSEAFRYIATENRDNISLDDPRFVEYENCCKRLDKEFLSAFPHLTEEQAMSLGRGKIFGLINHVIRDGYDLEDFNRKGRAVDIAALVLDAYDINAKGELTTPQLFTEELTHWYGDYWMGVVHVGNRNKVFREWKKGQDTTLDNAGEYTIKKMRLWYVFLGGNPQGITLPKNVEQQLILWLLAYEASSLRKDTCDERTNRWIEQNLPTFFYPSDEEVLAFVLSTPTHSDIVWNWLLGLSEEERERVKGSFAKEFCAYVINAFKNVVTKDGESERVRKYVDTMVPTFTLNSWKLIINDVGLYAPRDERATKLPPFVSDAFWASLDETEEDTNDDEEANYCIIVHEISRRTTQQLCQPPVKGARLANLRPRGMRSSFTTRCRNLVVDAFDLDESVQYVDIMTPTTLMLAEVFGEVIVREVLAERVTEENVLEMVECLCNMQKAGLLYTKVKMNKDGVSYTVQTAASLPKTPSEFAAQFFIDDGRIDDYGLKSTKKSEKKSKKTKSKKKKGAKKPTEPFVLKGRNKLNTFFNESVVDVILNEEVYQNLGINFPEPFILEGPPGCGKTFAVERLAEYLDIPTYHITSDSVGSTLIHETSMKIERTFKQAKEDGGSIVIIDEMDAMMPNRAGCARSDSHNIEEVSAFLKCIQTASENKVLVVGMTNFIKNVDPAILRTGRMGTHIKLEMPNEEEIVDVLQYELDKRPHDEVDLKTYAPRFLEHPLSDVAAAIKEAAMSAGRRRDTKITEDDVEKGVQRVLENVTNKDHGRSIGFCPS